MNAGPEIADRLEHLASERPGDPAIIAATRTVSWSELDALAGGLERRLGDHGRVALIAAPSAGAIAVLHAALRGRFDLVAINARAAAPEVAGLVERAGATLLLADGDRAAGLPGRLPVPIAEIDATEELDPTGSGARVTRGRARSAELLVPTSGTTGVPRLARLGPASLEASARAWSATLPPTGGWLLSLGLGHVAGIGIVVRAARDGVPVAIPDDPDPAAMLEAIARARAVGIAISHISVVPVQLVRLLDDLHDAPPPPSIRAVLLGGAPVDPRLVERAVRAGWPVVPTYGLTETSSGVTALATRDAADHPATAGRALPGVELRSGPRGELLVRGPMVFAGYAGDEEATTAALDADGWFHTGDVAEISPDGYVRIVDRLDDLIVSGGENVAPAEVEAILLQHPAIADAGVIGVPDATWGRVPVAVVVPHPMRTVDPDDVIAFARSRLASFKVPARIVVAGVLPRSEGGKLLRRMLEPLVASGVSAPAKEAGRLAVVDRAGPPGAPIVVLLHATLASAASLSGLAAELAGDARVIALDRRGSGATPLAGAGPVTIGEHVADLLHALDDAGVSEPVVIVGHSFGGVVALEFGARHAERVAAIVAWEPPYLALAEPPTRRRFARLATEIADAHRTGGAPAAAARFYAAVNGSAAWDALPARRRASIGGAGDGALADATMPDLDPAGLARITAPVVIATGGRGDPLYAPIAAALVARIPTARLVDLAGLEHMAPSTDPQRIADLTRELLARIATQEPSS